MKLYILFLLLPLMVGCATSQYNTRIYDFRHMGGITFYDCGEDINEEFDNIYRILNKEAR